MNIIVQIVVVFLKAILPALFQNASDSAEDADPQTELRDKLRKRINSTWTKGALLLALVVVLPGCFVRTIYVEEGTPVRLRETIPDAKVWIKDKDGKDVKGRLDLAEGWYAVSLDDK